MLRSRLTAALLGGLALLAVSAPLAAKINVVGPWARLQPPSAEMSAAFLVLQNDGSEADALVGASCDCAKVTELHVMQEVDGKMTMRPVERFDIPARGQFELRPMGPHLMLIGLTEPLAVEKPLKIRLRFEHEEELEVLVPVRDPRAEKAIP